MGLPDISELRPQLQQEWHPDNNALLGGIQIKPNSSLKIKWSCPNCPAGYPHVWQATVNNRTRGTKCPFCQGKALCRHSSLATKAPRQTRYLNKGENAKTPEQTFAGIDSRRNMCTHPTFEAVQHPLLMEWDYERNTKDNIHPQNITLGSRKLVHWVCHKCPKGQLHRYQMSAAQRTRKPASGCPYCAGRQVCNCNSLAVHDPLVSSEWDFGMNDMTPADVTMRSNKVVWWKNNVRGSWQQRITDRTDPRLDKPNDGKLASRPL